MSTVYGLLYLNEIKYDDIAWTMLNAGRTIKVIDTGISIHSKVQGDIDRVKELLTGDGIDVAITMDFAPAVSDACESLDIKYVSWIYDMPQQELYEKQVGNDCNYIFSFDKIQIEQIKEAGGKHVFYQPLATNVYRNSGLVINPEDEARFSCDVSFAGSLYNDDSYGNVLGKASDETQSEIEAIVNSSFGIWDGKNRINGRLSDSAISELWKIYGGNDTDSFSMDKDTYLGARLFARYISFLERSCILESLSDYDVRLHTNDTSISIPGVKVGGRLSYDEELPRMYYLSKINLNISLHSILSGVPLRVFDIMGVGGFMLTNYQPEIEELFTIGKDIEVFHDIDELHDKVSFYLANEKARLQIALNGYKLVSEKYSYDRAIESILAKIG